jgi:hypothetical protein
MDTFSHKASLMALDWVSVGSVEAGHFSQQEER